MAGSISGINQQQVPLSQPFQPGGSEETRQIRLQDQEQRAANDVQVRGAPAAETDNSSKSADSSSYSTVFEPLSNGLSDSGSKRGSTVNMTV